MKVVRTLIIDDEPQARRRLERLLKLDPVFEIVGLCNSAKEAHQFIKDHQIDLMFLDIEMPGQNGFKFMASIPEEMRPGVVFVTAFDDYAVMAFEYFALDYILKPFSNDRFNKTLDRIKQQFQIERKGIDWNLVNSFIGKRESPKDRFVIKTGNKYDFLAYTDINYILANGTYATFVCHDGRKMLYRQTITNLSEILKDFGFVRIHHSAIVFSDNIKGLNRLPFGDIEVIMNDGVSVRVSRSYKNDLKKILR
jgi:two-component system, LytTR family, response regulator